MLQQGYLTGVEALSLSVAIAHHRQTRSTQTPMESWSDEFSQMMEAWANEVEQFCTEVAKEISGVLDAFVEASEEMIEQMQNTFTPELEQQISEFFNPILEAYLGFEIILEETAQPILHTIDPIVNDHPACAGCRHYHGQVYGNTPLICGMHPYGWDGEKCPDWESTWQD